MLHFHFLLIILTFQDNIPLKSSSEFEVKTNYELRKKPAVDRNRYVYHDPGAEEKEMSTDVLPYLILQLKIKRWSPDVTQIKISDGPGKVHLKKKPTDDGIFMIDLGFVDDMKDKVTSGKYFINFIKAKKIVEQITIEVEEDGTFLVNGEKRGKF